MVHIPQTNKIIKERRAQSKCKSTFLVMMHDILYVTAQNDWLIRANSMEFFSVKSRLLGKETKRPFSWFVHMWPENEKNVTTCASKISFTDFISTSIIANFNLIRDRREHMACLLNDWRFLSVHLM